MGLILFYFTCCDMTSVNVMQAGCLLIVEFSFDGFSVDMTRSMVAMSDVSFVILTMTVACCHCAQYLEAASFSAVLIMRQSRLA